MAENVEAESAQEPIDAGLRCLHCGYNLTGTVESRCPECGEGFDRADLERCARGEPVPATPFDLEQSWKAFWRTWRRVVFSPRRFVEELPPAFDWKRAAQYSVSCYLFSAVLITAGVAVGSAAEGLLNTACELIAFLLLGAIFCFWLFEALMARVLSETCPRAHTYHPLLFWRGVLHYTSSYTILLGVWFSAIGLTIAITLRMDHDPFHWWVWPLMITGGLLAVVLWWLVGLCAMIWRRSRSKGGALLACAAAPVLAVLTIALYVFLMSLFPYSF